MPYKVPPKWSHNTLKYLEINLTKDEQTIKITDRNFYVLK